MKDSYVYEPQVHTEKSLRPLPKYGQGTLSWQCKPENNIGHNRHRNCTKLSCPCACHRLEETHG